SVLDGALEGIAAQALAVHLADEVRRHLAGTEAGHPDLGRQALHFGLHPSLDVGGGDGQHEGALQALIFSLDGFDGHVPAVPMKSMNVPRRRIGAGEGTRTPTSFDTGT